MQIKQRIKINSIFSGCTVIVMIAIIALTAYNVNRAIEASKIADAIIRASYERLLLRIDNYQTGSERSKVQLIAKQKEVGDLLKVASEKFWKTEDKKTISDLVALHEITGRLSRAIREIQEKRRLNGRPDALSEATENTMINQLNMSVYETILLDSKLQNSGNEAVYEAFRMGGGGILLVLVTLSAMAYFNARITGRIITDRMYRLRDGASIIGEGNLDHRIDLKGDDEFAELSGAFNAMTEKLQSSYVSLNNEISERKRVEEALKKAHEDLELLVDRRTKQLKTAHDSLKSERKRLYDVFEALPAMICLLTPDYHVAFANKGFRDRFGESHGRHCYDYCFGKNEPCEFCESYTVLKTGQPHYWEVTNPDGSIIAAHDFPFIDIDGQMLILEMDIDITEQRRAEKAIREINETLEQKIIERTADLRAANENLEASRMAALNLMEDAVAARKEAEDANAALLREADERKKTQDALIKSNADLAEVNRELESFIYSASHDLRAPLRSIAGFAEMVRRNYSGTLDEKGSEYLSRIVNGAGRMTRIIDDLLHLSRVSRQDMVRVWVDMSKKASAIVAELRDSDTGRNVKVSIADSLTAFADPGLIGLALSNLIGNAWKFTSKTENACIEFGSFDGMVPDLSAESGGHATSGLPALKRTVYFVKDNGAGFDPKHSQKMFWPFHRLHAASQFEGTGIGLAIVERVIRRHGGRVWAEGEVGKGTAIYFTLED